MFWRNRKEEEARECYEDKECRLKVVEMMKEEIADALDSILVEAIKAANERPAVWWQWLLLFTFGALAGVGLGFALAAISGAGHPTTQVIVPSG